MIWQRLLRKARLSLAVVLLAGCEPRLVTVEACSCPCASHWTAGAWADQDADGTRDLGEQALPGVVFVAEWYRDCYGQEYIQSRQITDGDGLTEFRLTGCGCGTATYYIEVPAGYEFSGMYCGWAGICSFGLAPSPGAPGGLEKIHSGFAIVGATATPGPATPAPIPEGTGKLDVSIVDERAGSVTVLVNYDCPFVEGEVRIRIRRDRNVEGATLDYEPAPSVVVPRGSDEITFDVQGREGTTDWIVVRLRSIDEQCEQAPRVWTLDEYLPGEYIVDECVVWKIIEYHKVWPEE